MMMKIRILKEEKVIPAFSHFDSIVGVLYHAIDESKNKNSYFNFKNKLKILLPYISVFEYIYMRKKRTRIMEVSIVFASMKLVKKFETKLYYLPNRYNSESIFSSITDEVKEFKICLSPMFNVI